MQNGEQNLTPEQTGDIDWLAFCYVANEMTADQRDRFEQRLADDQQAREAVALAVELTQTIAGIEPVEPPAEPVDRQARPVGVWQTATWIATAVAASLAIVVGYQLVSQVTSSGDDPSSGHAEQQSSPDGEPAQLVQAWLEAGGAPDVLPEEDLAVEDAESFPPDPDEDLVASDDDVVEAPDWMMSAVSGMLSDDEDARKQ